MDILIKNMEMPSKCFDCGFCYDGDRIRYCLATPWQKEIRKEVFPKRREDFCPLVALPERGDLVSRDSIATALRDYLLAHFGERLDEDLSNAIYSFIAEAETIVEATE